MNGTSTNGRSKDQLIPTNTVSTADGQRVRARIEPSLPVADVIHQLCVNLKMPEPSSFYALRDEDSELVTDENLRKKVKTKAPLQLVNAPHIEAIEIVDKLSARDENGVRHSLPRLIKYIREEAFAETFLARDGLHELMGIIMNHQGNILASALNAMQNLMELDYGWSTIQPPFISRVVQILSNHHSMINVCRPATAILKRLVEADPRSAPQNQNVASSSKSVPIVEEGSVFRYGFDVVYDIMRAERGLMDTVVARLDSPDSVMALNSMMLINSLLSHATDLYWEDLTTTLERLNVRKSVTRLMSSHSSHLIEDLTSSILSFQSALVRLTFRKKTTPVNPEDDPAHEQMMNAIWNAAKLVEEYDSEGIVKWRKLGFDSEDLTKEFEGVGVLGLECLKSLVQDNPDFFAKAVLEQISRPYERRCPVARASNEVVELLSEHWEIYAPGYTTSTTFIPLFLNFPKVHALATQFFLRMWNESGAAHGDFTRVSALVRSQVKVALRRESSAQWHEVEASFVDSEYREVRDRQMKELEMEDDILTKLPVRRNLRANLYKESFEFVRSQRLQCMIQGAWFVNGIPLVIPPGRDPKKNQRPWRFMRLDQGMKYIHYTDTVSPEIPIRNGLEDLPDRIEVASITEISINSCSTPPNLLPFTDLPPLLGSMAAPYSFSLLSREGSLADQVAMDSSRWADWTDGLNMLRKDGGHVATQETAGFVHALTEIGLKIKLLDLSGEQVEIPSSLYAGPPPPSNDFFFSDLSHES
ncbi:hypothetical protein SISSUDRAFT_1026750 [Sistotremastrum suecicum HHB10207 ss-3]|uniref:ELMO domain-containing protein n=1 Tax=Sistotremastrum suecicum HHB10207 ss-3 TaxID=1314776 RepID=A0A165ZJ74_9AGAM|nr:hypothetical protein SISSUDRAFT_1026750 [Sistotremastrum suecicum HHB10207 ss-3]